MLFILQWMDLNVNINNVVSGFSTRCHLNLKKICKESCDVEFKKDNNVSVKP